MNLNQKELYIADADFNFYPTGLNNSKSVSPVGKYQTTDKSNFSWLNDDELYNYIYYIRKDSSSDVFDYDHWAIGRNKNNQNFYIYYSGEKEGDHTNETELYAVGENEGIISDIYFPTGWTSPDTSGNFEILINDSLYQKWIFHMNKARLDYKITGGVDVVYLEDMPELNKDIYQRDGWEIQIKGDSGPFTYYLSNNIEQDFSSATRLSNESYIRISRDRAQNVFGVDLSSETYFFIKKGRQNISSQSFSYREYDVQAFLDYQAQQPAPPIPPSLTPTRTATPTATPSVSITPTITKTPSVTSTVNASPAPTPSTTPTSTQTPTATPTVSITPAPPNTVAKSIFKIIKLGSNIEPPPSATPTQTITPTITKTPSVTPTKTPTTTPTTTPSLTTTTTPQVSPSATQTQTPTITPTVTPTITPTISRVLIDGWNQNFKINTDDNDLAGYEVSISEDSNIFAVGFPQGLTNKGFVSVYEKTESGIFTIGDDIRGDQGSSRMGTSVSLSADGQTLAVGAREDSTSSKVKCGSVKVYNFDSTSQTWNQVGDTFFGEENYIEQGGKNQVTLSKDGNILAISNPTKNINSGSIRVYKKNEVSSNVYNWINYGTEIHGSDSEFFGQNIDLNYSGNIMVVGSENPLINTLVKRNYEQAKANVKVYEYDNSTNDWSLLGSEIKVNKDYLFIYDFSLKFSPITGANQEIESYFTIGGNIDSSIFLRQDPANTNQSLLIGELGGSGENIISTGINGSGSFITGIIESELSSKENIDFEGNHESFNLRLNNFYSLGSSVSINDEGNIIAIGSRSSFVGDLTNVGHVEAYEYSSNQWNQIGDKITGSYEYGQYGYNVKLGKTGDFISIASPMYGSRESLLFTRGGQGILETYKNEGNNWVKFNQSIYGSSTFERFGFSLDSAMASEKQSIIVGSPFHSSFDYDGFDELYVGDNRKNKDKVKIIEIHKPDPSVTPTVTATPTSTLTPTSTITPTISITPTITPTVTSTSTITPTNSVTPTATATPTSTLTPTSTTTVTPTVTVTPTATVSPPSACDSFQFIYAFTTTGISYNRAIGSDGSIESLTGINFGTDSDESQEGLQVPTSTTGQNFVFIAQNTLYNGKPVYYADLIDYYYSAVNKVATIVQTGPYTSSTMTTYTYTNQNKIGHLPYTVKYEVIDANGKACMTEEEFNNYYTVDNREGNEHLKCISGEGFLTGWFIFLDEGRMNFQSDVFQKFISGYNGRNYFQSYGDGNQALSQGSELVPFASGEDITQGINVDDWAYGDAIDYEDIFGTPPPECL